MSKAVEKAYKAYPLTEDNRLNHERNAKRLGFQQGYEQAEKDLELTWEDIEKITDIWDDLHEDEMVYSKTGCDTPEFYQKVQFYFSKSPLLGLEPKTGGVLCPPVLVYSQSV